MAKIARELKKHLDHEGQLALLEGRGLAIGDRVAAMKALERLGYYRLSGYFYPLRRTKPLGQAGRLDQFVDGASFELVVLLAEFDKALRLLALNAIETIEIAIRVAIAHRLGSLDPEAHLLPKYLDRSFVAARGSGTSLHQEWLVRFEKQCEQSKEDFAIHHRMEYAGRMPIWVAVELWDFGLLSFFFSGMHKKGQATVARPFAPIDGPVLASWLRSFSFVRNVSAHHSRLWNRTTPFPPRLPAKGSLASLAHLSQGHDPDPIQKLYGTFACLRVLLRTLHPGSTWHSELKQLATRFPKTPLLSLQEAGFPVGWEALELWR